MREQATGGYVVTDVVALFSRTESSIAALSGWDFTPLRLSPGSYGRVPKIYIECLRDRAVTLGLQRQMQADSPCDRTLSIDTGHSPFFAMPETLAILLLESLRPLDTPRRS